MSRVAVRLAALAGLAGCAFAHDHPAVTVGLASGSIAFGACELDVERIGTCGLVGGGVGLVLGGLTALITTVFDTSAHELPSDEPEFEIPEHGEAAPADAGVPATGADAATPPRASADARVPASAPVPDAAASVGPADAGP